MKKTLFLFLIVLFCNFTNKDNYTQKNKENKVFLIDKRPKKETTLKVLTWNIQNLGKTKNSTEISAISHIIKNYDLIAIQEVVAKDPKGAQAVAKIVSTLNRLGNKWDYSISKPTKSPSNYISERYAYIWKTSKLTLLKKAYLDSDLENIIEREPYLAQFEIRKNKKHFYFINIHARVYNKHPEIEIAHFKKYPKKLKTDNIIILGDFNLNEKHSVWNPLYKMEFKPAVKETPTTLNRKCKNGNYTNHAIDNIYYNSSKMKKINAGVIDFVTNCKNLQNARMLSDHLPVFIALNI